MDLIDRPFKPDWQDYFMRLAHLVSLRANCMKRSIGAIIVKDKRVIATGYNGTPFGFDNCVDDGCKRCNDNCMSGKSLDKCNCLHAEENAVLEAGKILRDIFKSIDKSQIAYS